MYDYATPRYTVVCSVLLGSRIHRQQLPVVYEFAQFNKFGTYYVLPTKHCESIHINGAHATACVRQTDRQTGVRGNRIAVALEYTAQ